MMNETFMVAAVEDCASVMANVANVDDYLWRETKFGCKVLLLLQEIHKFNITYVKAPRDVLDYNERKGLIYNFDDPVDIYVKPRTLWIPNLNNATPIMPMFVWNFGFTLRLPDPDIQGFFRRPFTPTVWNSIIIMVLLASLVFYTLKRAEQCLLGRNLECNYSHEVLLAIGACCQHYLPVNTIELTSRRIAFCSFFLFCYVIYAYYTSTLLSDLVHDKGNDMDLETLADSTYNHVVLENEAIVIKVVIEQMDKKNSSNIAPQKLSFIKRKLTNIQVVNMSTGLAEIETGRTALLSDYASLFWAMKENYDNNVICELVEVKLFSNVLKYLFTAKKFKYIEEFKMSTLRTLETGVLRKLLRNDVVPPLLHTQCTSSHFQAQIGHAKSPLIILAFTYILCGIILLGEKIYFERNRVWPYVE